MKIILGSSSKIRKQMLEEMGLIFEAMSPDIDEKAIRDDDPQQLVLKLGRAKADALLPRIHEPALLITSDHVITFHGVIFEKPDSMEQARVWLRQFQNDEVVGVTSVVVTNTATHKRGEGVAQARVHISEIPDNVLEKYLATSDPLSAAGALRIQLPIIAPYCTITSGTFDTMMALDKDLTRRLLNEVQTIGEIC